MAEDALAVGSVSALGTRVQVAVTDAHRLDEALALVTEWLGGLDLAASRFRGDSEITQVNGTSGEVVALSPLLARLIAAALEVAAMTDGIVDPTVGSAMEAIGYDRDFARVVGGTDRAVAPGVPAPGWQTVHLDRAAQTVRLEPGMLLDLGSSSKAFAADETAALASAATGAGVLVNLGGDIAVAGAAPAGGWPVRVTDDHAAAADAPGQTVAITAGGLATSSTTVRAWSAGGSPVHHIVDPRTGAPAPVVWRTASATGSTCLEANAATTAAIVLGELAAAWIRERGIPARLVGRDDSVLHLNGWPDAGDETQPAIPSDLTD
ncbi:MAG: FAD:protein FMN transferase [Candidatus Dormibacteria bacterium]